jgi:hypothetical protein
MLWSNARNKVKLKALADEAAQFFGRKDLQLLHFADNRHKG